MADRDGLGLALAEADHRQVASDQLLGAVRDPSQDRVDVERRGDRLRDAGEHLRLPPPALTLLVQARVLQRERRLVSERLHELDLPVRERADVVAIRDEGAEHPVADEERHGHHGPIALGLDGGARRRREVERRIVQQIGRPDRATLRDRGGRRAVARMQRAHGLKCATHSAARHEEQGVARPIRVHERDRGSLGAEQSARAVDDQRQDLLELQRRRDRAAELGERLGLAPAGRVVGEQSRVMDRRRRVVGEPEQDLLVTVREDAVVPVGDREKPFDAVLDRDGHRHERAHALCAGDRRVLRADPRVLEIAGRAEGSTRREDFAARALTSGDPERGVAVVPRAGPVAKGHGVDARVAERDERHVAAADLSRPLGDALEHGREVERGVDAPDHVRQQLGLSLATARVLVEARVLDGDGRLVGEEPGEVLLFGGEVVPTAEPDDERADRAIVVDQRERDASMEVARFGHRAMPPPRILLDVLDVFGTARGEHRAGDALVARNGIGAHAAAGELRPGPEAAAFAQDLVAVVHPDVGHPRLQEDGGGLGDAVERRGAVGRRRHQARQPAERGQALGARVGLSKRPAVGIGRDPRPPRGLGGLALTQCRSASGRVLDGAPARRPPVSGRGRR